MEPLGLYLIQYYFSGSCMLNNRILRPPYSTTTTSLPHLKLKFSGDATNTYTLTLSLNCGVTVGNVLACQLLLGSIPSRISAWTYLLHNTQNYQLLGNLEVIRTAGEIRSQELIDTVRSTWEE